jgi:hypothetical protein
MTPHSASIHFGLRGSWISDLFRKDRGSITLGRLDELADYLGERPRDLIDSSGHPPPKK